MSAFTISSIQQIGLGTSDFRGTWNWQIDTFGFDVKILEDDTVAERMLPYTGGKPWKRHACIAVNLQGGGGLEIWQYSERIPVEVQFKVSVADIGIFAAKIKSRDVKRFHESLCRRGIKCGQLSEDPGGIPCFYTEDSYGNIFQIVEKDDLFLDDGKECGGIAGAMIGVNDMDRSLKFYREILGYDTTIYDRCGRFDDWVQLRGSEERYRRVLLGKSADPETAFSGLLGTNTIELVQALDRQPKRIYEGRLWGDPGFIQICYDVHGMDALGEFCKLKGFPFTVDSCPGGERFDMGEASGRFTYVEDPDGTLIEFVETYRIPIIVKLGLYIDISRRNQEKRLPKFLFRIIGAVSRQKTK